MLKYFNTLILRLVCKMLFKGMLVSYCRGPDSVPQWIYIYLILKKIKKATYLQFLLFFLIVYL